MTVDGQRVTLTGNPNALMECVTTPCDPPPGSAAAFAEFWRRLGDLGSWIPNELGPASPYVAPAYAILVGPPPTQDPNFSQPPMDWPLEQPLALFGGPVADGTYRCGTASGADADTLRPSLEAANQLTQWVQDPTTSATFGLDGPPDGARRGRLPRDVRTRLTRRPAPPDPASGDRARPSGTTTRSTGGLRRLPSNATRAGATNHVPLARRGDHGIGRGSPLRSHSEVSRCGCPPDRCPSWPSPWLLLPAPGRPRHLRPCRPPAPPIHGSAPGPSRPSPRRTGSRSGRRR